MNTPKPGNIMGRLFGSTPTPTPTPTPPMPSGNPCSNENIASVTLVFFGKLCGTDPSVSYSNTYKSSTTPAWDGSQSLTFKDTALAYVTGTGDPTNKAILDALANQFGTDFLNWINFTGDVTYDGVAAVVPNGLYDEIVIDYFVEDNCKTRVMTPPPTAFPRELGHYDYPNDCTQTAFPCVFFYGPPASCSGGSLKITRYKMCIEDGRLSYYFVSTDTLS